MSKEQSKLNQKKKNSRNHKLKKRIIVAAVAAIVMGGIAWAKFSGNNASTLADALYTVKRGDLRISVLESGKIKARKSVSLNSEVDGQSTIINIVPEGSYVEEGDVLVVLDSSELRDRIEQQQISVESAQAAYTNSSEAYAIQENQNESDIKAAQLALDFAKIDLEKYTEGDWEQQKRKADNAIVQAQTGLEIAKLKLDGTKALYEKGYVTETELKGDQSSYQSNQISVQEAVEGKKLLQQYDHPKQLAKYTADYEESQKELERAKRRAKSQLAQKEADKKAKEAMYNMQKARLTRFTDQLEKTTIKAPQPGLVVYASSSEERWRRGGSGGLIAEGEKVYERQKIIELPDVSMMKVDVNVHESVRDMIKARQPAIITIEALSGLTLHAHVEKVAILPDSGNRWMNPDLTVYTTSIIIDGEPEALKSATGMTAKVEIIIADLTNVLYVPVQAVTVRREREVCYVMKGSRPAPTEVGVGMSNDNYVEIKSGLKERDKVLTYAPITPEKTTSAEKSREPAPDKGKTPPAEETAGTPGAPEKSPQDKTERPQEGAAAFLKNLTPEQKKAMQERLKGMGVTEEIDLENMTPEKMQQIRRKFMEGAGRRGQGPQGAEGSPRRRGPRPGRRPPGSSAGAPSTSGRSAPRPQELRVQ